MGGFVVLPRSQGEPAEAVEARFQKSLEVFAKKNLKLDVRLERDGFVAYRFNKIIPRHDAVIDCANGDFVFYTGTFFYDGATGKDALARFYGDYAEGGIQESKLAGNFCLVAYVQGVLATFTDYCGYYSAYVHRGSGAVSNSLLALARLDERQQVSAQEFYEYILHGFFIGKETFLQGIEALDSQKRWRIYPALAATARAPVFDALADNAGFNEIVERVSGELGEYFHLLARLYADDIGSALSGGYDSRHMVALLRQAKVQPYLYVYGGETASDVVVAKDVAAAEGLNLVHINKALTPRVSVERFAEIVRRDVYFFDGLKTAGLADDGSDMDTRLARAKCAYLHLNGAGGEIYREIWNISDRKIDLLTFIRLRFDLGAYAFCRGQFKVDDYFARFAGKVREILAIDRDLLNRDEAELLFPFLRNRFAQSNNTANAQISDSLLPFMEPRFVFPSAKFPIKYKYAGELHAALLRKADAGLAKRGSSYGINFYDPVPAAYRAQRMLERHIPLSARLLARKYRAAKPGAMPYYLAKDYIESVVDYGAPRVGEFVDFANIKDPEILSRALSVEVMLGQI